MRYKCNHKKKLYDLRKRDFLRKSLDKFVLDIQVVETNKSLGSGTYARAYRIPAPIADTHVVAKVCNVSLDMLGQPSNAFRSEHAEPHILRILYKHIVQPNVSPHIIAPLGQVQVEQDKAVYFMEYANGKTLYNFLKNASRLRIAQCCPEILFQICFTLHAIRSVFPTFRHNDLIASNVFLQKTETGQAKTYQLADGRTYRLPGCGFLSLLADMDFASIPGLVDNYKPIEHYFTYPTHNINAHKDGAAVDLYLAVKCMAECNALAPAFRQALFSLYDSDDPRWPDHPLKSFKEKQNFWRPPMPLTSTLPTPLDMLSSPIFASFAVEQTGADYVIPTNPTIDVPVLPHQKRHCPLFRSNPCVSWYGQLDAAGPFTDAATYVPTHWSPKYENNMCKVLAGVYRAQGFQEGGWPDVWQNLLFVARSAIWDWSLPYLWWPAAFTCAFVEATTMVGVVPLGHECWTFELWTEFWQDRAPCAMALSDPLAWLEFSMQWGW